MAIRRSTISLPRKKRERLRIAQLQHPDGQSGIINDALQAFCGASPIPRGEFVANCEVVGDDDTNRAPLTVSFDLDVYNAAKRLASRYDLTLSGIVEVALAWCGDNDRARFGWVTDDRADFLFAEAG